MLQYHIINKHIIKVTVIFFLLLSFMFIFSTLCVANESFREQAYIQMTEFIKGLELYKLDNGKYPTTEQGLQALVVRPTIEPLPIRWRQYIESIPLDPWGNAYIYKCPGSHYNENFHKIYKYCYCDVICHIVDIIDSENVIKLSGAPNICYSSQKGDIEAVKFFLKDNPQSVNINTIIGYATPLQCAIKGNNIKIVRLLLDNNADVNIKSEFDTPLHLAVRYGNIEIIRLLIASKGVNVNIKNYIGETPLHTVLSSDFPQKLEIVKLLVSHGANVNAKDNDGYMPLHIAVGAKDIKIVKILVSKGAHVNEKTFDGFTPLKLAIKNDSKDIINFLQKLGASK